MKNIYILCDHVVVFFMKGDHVGLSWKKEDPKIERL